MMNSCERRLINDVGYFEARYKRGGRMINHFRARGPRAITLLISVSQIVLCGAASSMDLEQVLRILNAGKRRRQSIFRGESPIFMLRHAR